MNGTGTSPREYEKRVLDNLNTVVLLFDTDLRLRYMNPAAEMLFQVSARHMLGLAADALIQCPAGLVQTNLKRALRSARPITERQISLKLHDDRSATVDCTVIPLNPIEGDAGLLVEIQQIDRQLRISREKLLISQQQATRDLIRSLAHEIKNPLGGLRGAAQLLERELADPGLREYTQIIIDEADRLQALVDGMVGPNKLPDFTEVNVHTLLERVRHLVLAEAGSKIRVTRDYDPSIPDVYVDSDRIIQALLNITRNAARAVQDVEDGEIVLQTRILRQFTIANQRHRLVVQIAVHDNGAGVDEKVRERLFYPMVTASEGGMGMGLSIAQSLINQHGGLVECRSEPGHTVFNVLLPLENPNAEK